MAAQPLGPRLKPETHRLIQPHFTAGEGGPSRLLLVLGPEPRSCLFLALHVLFFMTHRFSPQLGWKLIPSPR